jgi:hypothetical protein
MRFTRLRGRSIVTARNFTIAMVLVNGLGFYAVHKKMQQAQVPNAFALDAREQPAESQQALVLPVNTVGISAAPRQAAAVVAVPAEPAVRSRAIVAADLTSPLPVSREPTRRAARSRHSSGPAENPSAFSSAFPDNLQADAASGIEQTSGPQSGETGAALVPPLPEISATEPTPEIISAPVVITPNSAESIELPPLAPPEAPADMPMTTPTA